MWVFWACTVSVGTDCITTGYRDPDFPREESQRSRLTLATFGAILSNCCKHMGPLNEGTEWLKRAVKSVVIWHRQAPLSLVIKPIISHCSVGQNEFFNSSFPVADVQFSSRFTYGSFSSFSPCFRSQRNPSVGQLVSFSSLLQLLKFYHRHLTKDVRNVMLTTL